MLPGAEGEAWAPMNWTCQSRRSFRKQQPAKLGGWSRGRSRGWERPSGAGSRALGRLQPGLGVSPEGTGSCLLGFGCCGHYDMAFPVENGRKAQVVVHRVVTETPAGHKVCTVRGMCASSRTPVSTWRSQRLLPSPCGRSQEGMPRGQRAALSGHLNSIFSGSALVPRPCPVSSQKREASLELQTKEFWQITSKMEPAAPLG